MTAQCSLLRVSGTSTWKRPNDRGGKLNDRYNNQIATLYFTTTLIGASVCIKLIETITDTDFNHSHQNKSSVSNLHIPSLI